MMRGLLLESPPLDAAAQMALDEAVLEGAPEAVPVLRFYHWSSDRGAASPHAVTFGVSQAYGDVEAAVRRRLGAADVPLVRRATGGGIVYHGGDVTFSLVFSWPTLCDPGLVYKDIHLAAHLGFKALGIATSLWSPGREPGPRPECFAGPEPKDLVAQDGAKALGGALRRRRGRGLYQGSLRPAVLGADASAGRRALAEGLSVAWKALFDPGGAPAGVPERAERLRAERYASDHWNRRR